MPKSKVCSRGHSEWHHVTGADGRKFCDFILGVIGVEGHGHSAVMCFEHPTDSTIPKNMLVVGGATFKLGKSAKKRIENKNN